MRSYIPSLITALAIVITAMILAGAFRHRNRSADSISVTGLGSQDFDSDLIVWSGGFTRKNMVLKDAYAELDRDREKIKAYLTGKGISASQLVFSSVSIKKEYDEQYDNEGNRKSATFTGYKLEQEVEIESRDVNKIETLSREVSELINNGIEFYSSPPRYYYTKLSELKVRMIAEATADAKTRAEKIAENAGSGLSRLKSAAMGVFQIVAQNSAEDYSWGGSFNTSSKRKTANITVKLEYEVE